MRYLTYLTLLVTFTFFTCGLSNAQEWHVETIDSLSGAVSYWRTTSIALDSNNYPHMVYNSMDTPGLKYAHWTGSEWDIEFIESTGYVARSSIAIDSQDRPHIAYDIDYALKYAVWNGTDWEIETIVPQYACVPSLVLDSQDEPHIAFDYCEVDSDCDLRYAYRSEGLWKIEIVDPEKGSGWWVSLALDGNGYPHISYLWFTYSTVHTELRYAHWTGTEWQTETVDDSSDLPYPNSIAIAIDNQNHPHISYWYEDSGTNELRYAHGTGKFWDIQVLDSGLHVGARNSIALDSQDNPCIAYQAYFEQDNGFVRYAHWTGSEWNIQDVDHGTGIGDSCSLALDNQNYPHISYLNTSNDTLKLAWYGYDLAISLLSFTATPQEESSVLLNWQVETTEGEQIAGFNLYRREINNDIAAEVSNLGCIWTQVNPSLITGQNPYTYTDSSVELGKSYEYRLEAVLADESTEILGTASCAPTPPAFAINKVYPNPASDVLNLALTLPQTGGVTLELYDLTGRVVATKDIQISSPGEFTEQLDVGGLANGVYTLRATQNSSETFAKVVICK